MFVGVYAFGPSAASALDTSDEHLVDALNPYDQADITGFWRDEHAAIAQTLTWNTPESQLEEVPYRCAHSGRVVAAWVRLDNRAELADALGIVQDRLGATTDPMLLLAAYDQWGDDCVDHLLGDFSFVIYDPRSGAVFVARDPLGVRPLYYHASNELFVVATTAAVFHAIEGLELTPSEEWMALYVIGSSMSHTDTAWPQVKKLPGGHRMSFDVDGLAQPQRYHQFRDNAPLTFERDGQWVEKYRAVLEESVRCRLRTDAPLGVETSGGIDSSTCLGFAAHLWERSLDEIHTFGFVHCEDEPDYIFETSRLYQLENNHIHTVDGNQDVDRKARRDRMLRVLGYPEEHGNGSGHEPFYAECEQMGVRTLLSGFGGDEVVTNPGHLLRRELIDNRQFRLWYHDMHGRRLLKPLRLVRSFQRDRRGSKRGSNLRSVARKRWPDFALRTDVADRYGLQERYEQRSSYDEGFRTINAWALGERLSNGFVPTRLENCTLMAQARGVDYRWPLWDVRLVQQYLSTPSIEKKRANFGRYLHRRAIEGVVPPKVQWKPGKYMGEPLNSPGESSVLAAAQTACANLHPQLAAIVDAERLLQLAEASGADIDRTRMVRRQARSIQTLNRWLQTYHP